MANQEHVDRLLRGVEAWNQWREENPLIYPDLSGANLSHTNLSGVDFSDADLSGANLIGTNLNDANLRGINLSRASFGYVDFSDADLSGADFSSTYLSIAYFSRANLVFVDFNNADLSGANLSHADLSNSTLSQADLCSAELSGANLSDADLSGADLINSDLSEVQALGANFKAAKLTGACIKDWNINAQTSLQDVICEYIFKGYDYTKVEFADRRPHDPNQIFAPGEFTKRYQIVLETVDLFFNDGIDWKAFLASLQDLQTQYGNDLNIQGIEKKTGGSFVVRLEVPSDADKGAIERQLKDWYEANLKIVEAQYRAELQELKIQHSDEIITLYRQHNAEMSEIIKLVANRPITVENTNQVMVEQQSNAENYNTTVHGNVGNLANKMQDQSSQQTNQYIGANLNEITSLIHSLRGMAESFPEAQRTEALEHLEEIEIEIQQPPEKRKLSRMKAALLALVGTATAVSGAVAGANEFVGQVQELSDKLNIPLSIEQIEPQQ